MAKKQILWMLFFKNYVIQNKKLNFMDITLFEYVIHRKRFFHMVDFNQSKSNQKKQTNFMDYTTEKNCNPHINF